MKKFLSILFTITLISTFAFVFSSCDETTFNVNFMVDGEVYNTVSTEGKETIAIPENPTKEGYTFDGWYWDNETWQTPFTANSLLDAPLSSDMSVYAKWKQNVHIHTPVTDAGVLQTDTENGLTEGSHCSECGEVIVAQQVIPANLQGTDMKSTLLTVGDETLMASFPNATETFSFLKDIVVAKNAEYIVARDIFCESVISSKTVPLELGNNIYYILVTNGSLQKLYTVTIRRLPMYTVTFNSNGGTSVVSQTVEEGSLATEPTTSRIGYTFSSWSYDFTKPIMANTHINARWTPNTNTPYKVEYYLENLTKDGYDLVHTDSLTGTTASYVTAEIKDYEHFTYNAYISESSGNIAANGSLVLKVGYKRNSYTANGRTYPYGTEITVTPTANLGYTFNGWYINDELVSENYTYTCVIEAPIVAKFEVATEMENFNFSSSETTCTITGVKDNTVTEIIIPDYVTSIGSGTFQDCSKLTSITIPDSVISIGSSAFSGCSSLESITLPFVGSSKSATNASSSTLFGYIFGASSYTGGTSTKQYYSSSSYETYYIPTCLKSVTITGGNILYGAFYNCSSLTSITIPNSVTSIGDEAFLGCSSLTSITIPNSVTYIGDSAFSGCSSLTSITISNNVTSIGDYAFYYCSSLASVTIPNSVTSIGSSAFSGCSSLESITLPFVGSSKSATRAYESTLFGYIFGTASYTEGTSTKQYYSDSSSSTYYIPTSLKSVTITGGNILYGAFSDCSNLTNVTIGDGVKSIGSNAFKNCSSLASVTIPNSVTSIGWYAFYNCYNLTSITIPNSVTSIGSYAFSGCSSLTSVTFENTLGWKATYKWFINNEEQQHTVKITSSYSLADKSTAAEYLRSTYDNYTWTRSE